MEQEIFYPQHNVSCQFSVHYPSLLHPVNDTVFHIHPVFRVLGDVRFMGNHNDRLALLVQIGD